VAQALAGMRNNISRLHTALPVQQDAPRRFTGMKKYDTRPFKQQ
jgi:hypothetical protein